MPRINTHFDIDQQLCRVRHPGFVKVWISHEKFSFEIEPDVIKRNIVENGEFTDYLIGYDEKNNKIYDMDDSLLSLYAEVLALSRASKNSIRKHFIDLKTYNGWNVTEVKTDTREAQIGSDAFKKSKEEIARLRCEMICNAEKITDKEEKRLKNFSSRTALMEAKISRYWIEKFYDEDISPALVELDDETRYQSKVRMMAAYLSNEDQSINHDKPQQQNFSADRNFNYTRKILLKELFIAAKLCDAEGKFIKDKLICHEDLIEFKKICNSKRGEIETILKIDVRNDLDKKPMTQLGIFLNLLGISRNKPKNYDLNGKRVRYHAINYSTLEEVVKYAKKQLRKLE
ncbi:MULTISPECIES: hypothetical protein [unclassified Janthinobacterium]|uniref:hypothetical protein n=1 Tax=unclassified Janthinobacterium TaxID=2610881 RepID=UPI0016139F3D|nr:MULTISPECIES: hypothetical protein [unclassified Janthinobacterium]MBB5371080.1 hypothetical protein [Janthinobacterium sp. K2C7]MBB5383886.1 hypothetical protein [Janthinobacterium sp. K2Li3]MBB5389292.1 hypothetical protein [Janthinobacterium sp. K2E3]